MITVTTSTGFTCEIDEGALDDMELFEALCDLDHEDATALPRAAQLLLGKEQKKALYEHCRDKETKRVPITRATQEISEIFAGLQSKKK